MYNYTTIFTNLELNFIYYVYFISTWFKNNEQHNAIKKYIFIIFRQAFQNIYDSLKPNGDVLVAYLAEYPLFSIYEAVSKLKKWQPYMIDYQNFVSPYHNYSDTENSHKNILKKIGFDYVECKCERRTYVYKDFISWRSK